METLKSTHITCTSALDCFGKFAASSVEKNTVVKQRDAYYIVLPYIFELKVTAGHAACKSNVP